MGEVWVAKDRQTGGKIALKLLKVEAAASKEQRGRFEREARIARSLQSPNITRTFDSGVDEDGSPFMAMELLEGHDLQKRIKTEKVLPIQYVVQLSIQVGRALHVAHAAGLVHRDLKPANIFLSERDGEEIAKVLDFGIAKGSAEASEFTTAGEMLGTASYMSPEQIRNAKTVNHQADLWALAVVLFRALTGQFPFPETGFELFLALTQDPLPTPIRITSLVPALPRPLDVFFERAFTRDVASRYPNASAMIVGFCRAAGVTVPQDILSAADSPMPERPLSGQFPAVSLSSSALPPISGQPISGQPVSGQPISGQPISGQPISGQPFSGPGSSTQPLSGQPYSGQRFGGLPTPVPGSSPSGGPVTPVPGSPSPYGQPHVHEHPPASEPQGLSGTLMLDSLPDLAASMSHGPAPAAGRPASNPHPSLQDLDPDEPDNASTLFYQPGLQVPMDIRPDASRPNTPPPGFGPPAERPQVFTAPLDAVRAAAADFPANPDPSATASNQPPGLNPGLAPGPERTAPSRGFRSAGLFIVIVIVVLLGGAAFAVLFLMKG